MNKKANEVFSRYSEDLRKKIKKITITDYQEDFDKIYLNYIENPLPKNELYH